MLSSFRILLIPLFVFAAFVGNMFWAAMVLLLSAITDFADGFLARRFNWITNLGKILDPIADKLTQIVVCVVFFYIFPQFWMFFSFLIFKEGLMLLLGMILVRRQVPVTSARWFGKISTALFFVVMILIAMIPNLQTVVIHTMLLTTCIMALLSGVLYIVQTGKAGGE